MSKRLLQSSFFQTVIGQTMGGYMRLVGATTRWRFVDRAIVEQIWADGGPVIACIWHGRIMLAHKGWAIGTGGQPPKMLISQSREGGVVAKAARVFGAPVIRGSSAKGAKRKGGFEALREMLRHLETGGCIGITPDGPRGPRMRAQLGPIQLAKLSGAPIVCVAWAVAPCRVFSSWDRFILPFPFGRGVYVWGRPIVVARDTDAGGMERARLALETEMNRIAAEADRLAGVPAIDPAEKAPA